MTQKYKYQSLGKNKLAAAMMKTIKRDEERQGGGGALEEEGENGAKRMMIMLAWSSCQRGISQRNLTTLFWLHVATETSPWPFSPS